jgi:hypothetical protein
MKLALITVRFQELSKAGVPRFPSYVDSQARRLLVALPFDVSTNVPIYDGQALALVFPQAGAAPRFEDAVLL